MGHHEGDPVIGIYRTQEEVDAWTKRCPVTNFRRQLIEDYAVVTMQEIEAVEAEIDRIVEESVEFARRSPEPDPATAHLHVYADPVNPAEAFAPVPDDVATTRRVARCRARWPRRGDAPQSAYHLFR